MMPIALCPFNPIVGAVEANAQRMGAVAAEHASVDTSLVVFPELSICGYPPRDLLLDFLLGDGHAADALDGGGGVQGGVVGGEVLALHKGAALLGRREVRVAEDGALVLACAKWWEIGRAHV